MEALALTDHGNLCGAVEFLREAKAAGIKPIIGMEAYVAPGHRSDKSASTVSGKKHFYHLTLLARTGEGFRNLMRLSSRSFLEGFHSKPRIDKEILEQHAEGLICLSGCVVSEFSELLLNDKVEAAEQLVAWYQRVFGPENFFVEIQDNGFSLQHEQRQRAVALANRLGLPLVATSDAHYLTRDDAEAHDVLLCISTGKTQKDLSRLRFDSSEYYVRSPEEMFRVMPDHAEALAETARIAERVEENYETAGLGKRCFPVFVPPDRKTPEQYLRELCEEGLRDRYGDTPPAAAIERLDHELKIIIRMGFASYFLVVWDFVRYAREQGIPVGARGSACGALVSYVLKLSAVDPLTYDLLFERFLDPNRNEAPDIDIDLCQERRYEVIEYVRRKYGEENVAQIGTFMTLKAKAALTDVGRVMSIPLAQVEQVKKLIPNVLNITLEEALKKEPALRALGERDPEIGRMIDFAQRLEGTVRGVGTHAAGVVIASQPLIDLCPLQKIPNKDKDKEVVSTQWEMGDVEKVGLLKVDFLGLRNLTSLAVALRLIRKNHPDALKDGIEKLPLNDPETYALLQRGETRGVFQLESAGIRDLLVKMKPDRFADIIATNALYRPGPLNGGMVDSYVNRKHGREEPDYPHPIMREILEETYGVMVYQEQVMRILNRLGGIELSQAYATIKAISKKKADVIARGREQFISGATERGLEKDKASQIFGLIEHFGGYGFNKSHSTAYALLAYQTAYLKAHFPTEFMAAVLSSEMDGQEREKFFYEHIDDCRRMGIELLPPNINEGGVDFMPSREPGKIAFGLGAIKGVGFKAIESIARAREEGGPFRSLDDFCERVSIKEVGQGAIEVLIKAGAFDCLGARRSQLLAVLPRAVQGGQARQEDRRRGQRSLFDALSATAVAEPTAAASTLPDIPEFPDAVKLAEEKKVLGFYMSSHPLARYARLLEVFRSHEAAAVAELPDRTEVILGGMISGVKFRNVQSKKSAHTRMAKLNFEDLSGSTPALLWPEELARNAELVQDDQIAFVRGVVTRQRDPAEVVISKVVPIDRAVAELARGMIVTLRKGTHGENELRRIQSCLSRWQGNLEVYFEVLGLSSGHKAILRASSSYRVRYDEALLSALEDVVGSGALRVIGPNGAVALPSSS